MAAAVDQHFGIGRSLGAEAELGEGGGEQCAEEGDGDSQGETAGEGDEWIHVWVKESGERARKAECSAKQELAGAAGGCRIRVAGGALRAPQYGDRNVAGPADVRLDETGLSCRLGKCNSKEFTI